MSEREEVLTYFGWQTCVMGDECCHDECRIPVQMADEIVWLRSQLAAAEKVIGAAIWYIDGDVNDPWGYYDDDRYDDLWEAVTDEKDRRARAKETKR